MKTAADFLANGAETFRERNAVYGDNYLNVGRAMTGFFPKGLELKTEDDFNRFHLFMLAVVKMTRYTNNWSVGHADSIHDAMVYCAMVESVDANIAEQQKGDGMLHTVTSGKVATGLKGTAAERFFADRLKETSSINSDPPRGGSFEGERIG